MSPGTCLFLYILSSEPLGMNGDTEQLKKLTTELDEAHDMYHELYKWYDNLSENDDIEVATRTVNEAHAYIEKLSNKVEAVRHVVDLLGELENDLSYLEREYKGGC